MFLLDSWCFRFRDVWPTLWMLPVMWTWQLCDKGAWLAWYLLGQHSWLCWIWTLLFRGSCWEDCDSNKEECISSKRWDKDYPKSCLVNLTKTALIWSWDFAASNGTCSHLTSKAGWVIDLGFAVVTLLTLYLLLGFTTVFYLDGGVESYSQDKNGYLKVVDHHLLPLWHVPCQRRIINHLQLYALPWRPCQLHSASTKNRILESVSFWLTVINKGSERQEWGKKFPSLPYATRK